MSKNGYPDLVGTSIDLAVGYLRQGGIVAFPTETYYGLAVDPDCASAVTKTCGLSSGMICVTSLILSST